MKKLLFLHLLLLMVLVCICQKTTKPDFGPEARYYQKKSYKQLRNAGIFFAGSILVASTADNDIDVRLMIATSTVLQAASYYFLFTSLSSEWMYKSFSKKYDRALLNKSYRMEKIGHMLMGPGISLMGTGLLVGLMEGMFYDEFFSQTSTPLMLSGLALMFAGTHFYAVAKQNKKAALISFRTETIPQMNRTGLVKKTIPSLSLKINL
jgi:hypothetical protein